MQKMNAENKNIKQRKKRIRQSFVTVLASIVVFVTTYALIIPAITWEKTLICELEEHVHTDNCYNSKGVLKCGKEEHKHTADCFDAPKAAEKLYICGKAEHTHTDDCYFSDGTLKCTMQEHTHTSTCIPLMKLLSGNSFDPMSVPPGAGYADCDAKPKLTKQIDYLGDNGITGLDDLYRLYLSLELTPSPIDVFLVIDQSGSMNKDMMGNEIVAELEEPMEIECTIPFESFEWDDDEGTYFYEDEDEGYVYYLWDEEDSYIDLYWPEFDVWSDWGEYDITTGDVYIEMSYGVNPEFSGTTRQEVLMEFLNGKETDNSDGFIKKFREANENNHLAVLTFSGDCSLSTDRYIMPWDSTAVSIDDPPPPEGATNYSAALDIASQVLAEQDDCPNRKIMIFLSDGVPTVAYSDGQMQHSYANGNVIGSADECVRYSLSDEVKRYIQAAYNETSPSDPGLGGITRSFLKYVLFAEGYFEDDFGNTYNHEKFFSTADVFQTGSSYYSDTYIDYGFPQMVDLSFVTIPVPGINGMWGPFTTEDASEFLNWYNGCWNVWSDAEKDAWITANVTAPGGKYDLFYLVENSFLDFRQECPDVAVYTIGFSATDFNTLPSGRSGDEVLKYMAGDVGSNPSGRYYNCSAEDDLSRIILDIATVSGVSITDPLSAYVDLSEAPKLEVTMTLGEGTSARKYTLCTYDEDHDTFYYTEDGLHYLDTTATGFASDGTLNVVFDPDINFFEKFYCEVSFEVAVNQYAKDVYRATGYNVSGDDKTDRPGNDTSSLMPGFYSNDEATAKWTFGVKDEGEFPNPVVQVTIQDTRVEIQLKKIDAGTSKGIAGAEFDLYLEVTAGTEGSISYTDEENVVHHLQKINTESLVSECDTAIEVDGLSAGMYFLFETKAPDGYVLIDRPVTFDISETGITLSTGETNAQVDLTSPLLLEVKNFSSYRLPETGGIGTETFYVISALLMFGALTIGYIFWRRREERGEI